MHIKEIKEDFYSEFDLDIVQNLIEKIDSPPPSLELVGEGFHFRSYKYNKYHTIALVLSVAKSSFYQTLSSEIDLWIRSMRRLKSLDVHFVPPFEIVLWAEKVTYVTPYAPDPPSMHHPDFEPLEIYIKSFREKLHQAKLVIEDYLQIKCLKGVPFVIDWSDLKSITFDSSF